MCLSALRQLDRHVATTRSPAGRALIPSCGPTGTSSVTDNASAESATPGVEASTAAESPSSPRGQWPASTAWTMRSEPHFWALQQFSSIYCAFSSALLATIGGHNPSGTGDRVISDGFAFHCRYAVRWHECRSTRQSARTQEITFLASPSLSPVSFRRRPVMVAGERAHVPWREGRELPKVSRLGDGMHSSNGGGPAALSSAARHQSCPACGTPLSLSLHSARLSPFSPRAPRAAAARPQDSHVISV